LRRVWKKFWRLGSAATIATATLALGLAGVSAQQASSTQRHNELTLAGLRPGISKVSLKQKFPGLGLAMVNSQGYYWLDNCDGRMITIEADKDRRIGTITVSSLGIASADCLSRNEARLRASVKTGRGLQLADSCARVTELYGEPESRSPSVRGSRKLELLFYSFDWVGEDVPQSMEVSCDQATGRVVEITLASATL
jgi:hypothetical protein